MSLRVRVSFEPAEALARKIDSAAAGMRSRIDAVAAVNAVATRAEKSLKEGMNHGLNLSDAYVASRVTSKRAELAGKGAVVASVTADGRSTIISHYPFQQLRTRGDQGRGIGVATEIRKGGAQFVPHWFTMRLKLPEASGEKIGLFYRNRDGKVKHKYGPAPYSLFRFQVDAQEPQILDDLERTGLEAFESTLSEALK